MGFQIQKGNRPKVGGIEKVKEKKNASSFGNIRINLLTVWFTGENPGAGKDTWGLKFMPILRF